MAFADKTLVCRDCGNSFVFTSGEQEFFQSRGLVHEPARCPTCRQNRKKAAGLPVTGQPRQMFATVCANCNRETEVPFQPRLGRPVYCRECFTTIKAQQPQA